MRQYILRLLIAESQKNYAVMILNRKTNKIAEVFIVGNDDKSFLQSKRNNFFIARAYKINFKNAHSRKTGVVKTPA